MSWTIRRMTAGDIDGVVSLAAEIPEAPQWSREDYERCCVSDEAATLQRAGFVAEASGPLLGFSAGKLVAGICELESIAVVPETRGQGIGGALLEALIGWARVKGANRMELEVRASNIRAIKLYEQSGLRREGLRPAYYSSPEEDALLMGMSLRLVENFPEKRIASVNPEC